MIRKIFIDGQDMTHILKIRLNCDKEAAEFAAYKFWCQNNRKAPEIIIIDDNAFAVEFNGLQFFVKKI